MTTSRRELLVSTATIIGGVLTVSLVGCGGTDLDGLALEVAALLPPRARRLGNVYRKLDPKAGAPRAAAKELFRTLEKAGYTASKRESLAEGLDELMTLDYQAARTVELEGWVLSLTEARLCALVA